MPTSARFVTALSLTVALAHAPGAASAPRVPGPNSPEAKVLAACALLVAADRVESSGKPPARDCFDPRLNIASLLKVQDVKVDPRAFRTEIQYLSQVPGRWSHRITLAGPGGALVFTFDESGLAVLKHTAVSTRMTTPELAGQQTAADAAAIAWARACLETASMFMFWTSARTYRETVTCRDERLELVPEAFPPLKAGDRMTLTSEALAVRRADRSSYTIVNVQSTSGRWFSITESSGPMFYPFPREGRQPLR